MIYEQRIKICDHSETSLEIAAIADSSAAGLVLIGGVGVSNIGVVPIREIPTVAYNELTIMGTTGTPFAASTLNGNAWGVSVATPSLNNYRQTPLYSYSPAKQWKGDIIKTRAGGRIWVSNKQPGAWAFEPGAKNTFKRALWTGRIKPFNSHIEIPDESRGSFVPVRALGPFRGWKRLGGQFYAVKPGNMNYKSGEFLPPTLNQTIYYNRERIVAYTIDGTFVIAAPVAGGTYLYSDDIVEFLLVRLFCFY
jgi:hypothetical protein